ncbi:MAG: hypothetical protein R2911_03000 [Caldilineaceae bacterium]
MVILEDQLGFVDRNESVFPVERRRWGRSPDFYTSLRFIFDCAAH